LDAAAVEYRLRGRLDEAVTASEEAVEILRDPDEAMGSEKESLLLSALEGLAASYTKVGRLSDASATMQELDKLRARLSAVTTSVCSRATSFIREVMAETSKSSSRRSLGDGDRDMLAAAQQRVELYERLASGSPLYRVELADSLVELATVLSDAQEPDRALMV